MIASPLPPAARRAGRVFVWVLVALIALAVLAAVWLGVRGYLAYGHLQDAQRQVASLSGKLDDPDAAAAALPELAADTAAAHDLTSDPIWDAATALPWIGPQLDAIGTSIAAVDQVAGSALAPLAQSASGFSLQSLKPTDGRFDVAAIAALHEPAEAAAIGTAAAARSLDEIDDTALLAPLAAQVDEVRGLVDGVRTATDALSRATELLPAVLGADGPRNYLVLFQNNAEWRSLGGVVGALAVVHTEGGAVTLTSQAAASDFPPFAEPVQSLDPELVSLFDNKPARYIQNPTQIPDFAVSAGLAQTMWEQRTGTRVDGVIAIDPVALSFLLKATGPVTLPTGDVLRADDAVPLLLNGVYASYDDPAQQDAFFQSAAASVFTALASGAAEPSKLLGALAEAGGQDRILVWSASPEEQSVLDGTTLQGALPVTDETRTTFGVFLNDGTGSKMDYYAHVDVGTAWCADTGGAPDAALTVTLRSDAPADAANLPNYITGGGITGVPKGTTRTVAYLYLPEGSDVVFATTDATSGARGFGTGTDRGRTVLTWTTELAPGQEATASIRVRTPETPELGAKVTPVIPSNAGVITAACSAG